MIQKTIITTSSCWSLTVWQLWSCKTIPTLGEIWLPSERLIIESVQWKWHPENSADVIRQKNWLITPACFWFLLNSLSAWALHCCPSNLVVFLLSSSAGLMLSTVFVVNSSVKKKEKKRLPSSLARWCLCPLPLSGRATKRARHAQLATPLKPPCRWCHPSRRDRKSRICVHAICYSRQVCFIWVPLETKGWVICNFRHKWDGTGSAYKKKNIFYHYYYYLLLILFVLLFFLLLLLLFLLSLLLLCDPTAGVWTCFWLCFCAFQLHSYCTITSILSLQRMLQKEHRLPFIYCSRVIFFFVFKQNILY